MSAFSERKFDALNSALISLWNRTVDHLKPQPITPEGILGMVISPEHRDVLASAYQIAGDAGNLSHGCTITASLSDAPDVVATADPVQVSVLLYPGYGARIRSFIPTYAWREVLDVEQRDEPGEALHAQLHAWLQRYLSLKADFIRARAVLETLHSRCDTPVQVRYFLPAIVALLSEDEANAKLCDRLRDYRVPPKIPTTSPELRAACAKAQHTIARALLLPKQIAETTPGSAVVSTINSRASMRFAAWPNRDFALIF